MRHESSRLLRVDSSKDNGPARSERNFGPGYRGAHNELINLHGLSEVVVERALQQAADESGQPVTIAEERGCLYQVTASPDKLDSYTIHTEPIH
jgi:hypothetical protein